MGKHLNAQRGENHHAAKLTNKKVKVMRNLHYKKGMCIKCISTFYNVTYGTAWDAITYVTWKQVKE